MLTSALGLGHTSKKWRRGPVSVTDIINKYFSEGHTYEVILDFLENKHNICMSLRTLKRRLKDAGMTRRTDFTPTDIVISTVTQELRGSGQLLGYRSMCQTLRQKYNLKVKRNDVMHILSRLDPYGVKRRCKRRFVRRGYFSEGPNQVWHVDGYDKLKPFGVAISACVDGFSRKVMWLSCGSSNNDPGIIAKYYMECLSRFGQLPACFRTDCGTENGTMAAIHCALRSDHGDEHAGAHSHMYGTSTTNQRIESWWSSFRKQRYGGRQCGFQVPQDILHQFDDILPAQYSLCGDDNLQVHFTNLERQSELPRPVNWTTAVENYITLKNMTGL
ncbi:uncharacterized protein LOC120720815 isoform X2 [Simochromis diagramma]|uniref:uncharacterized protein LOC120720815 isoform X2 n=1 Tax=Simochromis diagramma TaxID=43689 RepID=UPI001A7EA63F|nr:uncharacterized protein LOC120720815 isoform X2 [Simochromis diagramma]